MAHRDKPMAGLPDRVGDFEVLTPLGAGSFGSVYLVRHVRTQAPAVVKFTQAHGHEADALLNEVAAFAKCTSAHIPRVLDRGQSDGFVWMACEFIDGDPLSQILAPTVEFETLFFSLKEGSFTSGASTAGAETVQVTRVAEHSETRSALPPAKATLPEASTVRGWMRDIATALVDLHAQRLIHRDIKPANIMISREGKAYLIDLGLAFELHNADAAGFAGTYPYMAPEQVTKDGRLSEQTDIYGFGATFFEALSGERLVSGKSRAEISNQLLFRPPLAPSDFPRSTPKDLIALVRQCVLQEPRNRMKSASHLLEGIGTHVSQRPSIRVAVLILIAILILGSIVAWRLIGQPESKPKAPPVLVQDFDEPINNLTRVHAILSTSEEAHGIAPHYSSAVSRSAIDLLRRLSMTTIMRVPGLPRAPLIEEGLVAAVALEETYDDPALVAIRIMKSISEGNNEEAIRIFDDRSSQFSEDDLMQQLGGLVRVIKNEGRRDGAPDSSVVSLTPQSQWVRIVTLLWGDEADASARTRYEKVLQLSRSARMHLRSSGSVSQSLADFYTTVEAEALKRLGRSKECLLLLQTLLGDHKDESRRAGYRVNAFAQALLVWGQDEARRPELRLFAENQIQNLKRSSSSETLIPFLPIAIENAASFCSKESKVSPRPWSLLLDLVSEIPDDFVASHPVVFTVVTNFMVSAYSDSLEAFLSLAEVKRRWAKIPGTDAVNGFADDVSLRMVRWAGVHLANDAVDAGKPMELADAHVIRSLRITEFEPGAAFAQSSEPWDQLLFWSERSFVATTLIEIDALLDEIQSAAEQEQLKPILRRLNERRRDLEKK